MTIPVKLLPLMMAGQSLIAGVVYLLQGDWRHAGYWFSSASIILFVTL